MEHKEMTTCEYDGTQSSYECAHDEQCDDCFMVDHQKECDWCTEYDHTVRKLEVKHECEDIREIEVLGEQQADRDAEEKYISEQEV